MQKQMPQYRVLLRDAWRLTKSYKQLWVWGFFASLLGSFGEYEAVGRIFQSISIASGNLQLGDSAFSNFYSRALGSGDLLLEIFRGVTKVPTEVVLVSIVIVVGFLFLLWLAFTGVIALIAETNRLTRSSKISIADGFLASQKYLLPTVIIYGFGRLLMTLVGTMLILFGLMVLVDVYLGTPLLITSFILLIPLLLFISFVSRFTVVGIIVKGKTIYHSLVEAVMLARKHWLVTLEVALMLMIISVAVSLLAVIVVVVTTVPLVTTAVVLFEAGRFGLSSAMLFVGVLCVLMPIIVAATFIGTYQWIVWTLLFNYVSKRDSLRSKIIRLAEKVVGNKTLSRKKK